MSVCAFARALLPPSLREVTSGHCLPQPLAATRGRGTASAVEGVPASRMTEGALPQSSPRAALTAPSEREPLKALPARDVEDAVPYDRRERLCNVGHLCRDAGLRAADSRPYGEVGRSFLIKIYTIYTKRGTPDGGAPFGAGGGTRTHTMSPSADFESATSTIPSHRHVLKSIYRFRKNFKSFLRPFPKNSPRGANSGAGGTRDSCPRCP